MSNLSGSSERLPDELLIQSSKLYVPLFNETGGVCGPRDWLEEVVNDNFKPESWSNLVIQRNSKP